MYEKNVYNNDVVKKAAASEKHEESVEKRSLAPVKPTTSSDAKSEKIMKNKSLRAATKAFEDSLRKAREGSFL